MSIAYTYIMSTYDKRIYIHAYKKYLKDKTCYIELEIFMYKLCVAS